MTQIILPPDEEFSQLLLGKLPPIIARKDVERQIGGEVVFSPSVQGSLSPWAESGLWHWPVVSVRALEFRQCKGQLGIFKVDYQELTSCVVQSATYPSALASSPHQLRASI